MRRVCCSGAALLERLNNAPVPGLEGDGCGRWLPVDLEHSLAAFAGRNPGPGLPQTPG